MLYEKKILDYWKKNDINKKSLNQNKGGKQYIFYDGPPFATGLPHYGQLLCSIAKDVIPRYWRMKGYYVPAKWGWDCHGLPIEEIVERKLKISGKKEIEKIGIKKFNETCKESVLTFAGEWKDTIERIGRFVDFDNSYKTMDSDYMESVWWGLKEIYKKGLIYEDKKVLFYCPRCETPVSNFEVAMDNSYKDVTEESVFVKFLLKKTDLFADLKRNKDIFLVAWTTTPWTLPSNMALAVSKKIDYSLIEENGNYYIFADFFIQNIKNMKNAPDYKIIKKLKGKDLAGLRYVPIYSIDKDIDFSKNYKICFADFVLENEGTGIIHIAPMHGEDDFNLGKKNKLSIFPLINEQGKFNQLAPTFLHNIDTKEANKLIKKDLANKNMLYKRESVTHSCAFCFRCNTRLFYYAIPSWFINVQKNKKRLLELNQKINWYPEHLKNGRFGKGLETAPDWNISRNRYWGSAIPLWKCQNKKCSHQEFIGSKKDIIKQKFSTNNYFFMRHATAVSNLKNIISSIPEKFNNPLVEKGVKEAEITAKKLKNNKINLIISSSLLRAKETAEIVAKEIGYPIEKIEYNKNLTEIKMGIFNGKLLIDWLNFYSEKLEGIDKSSKEYYLKKYEIKAPEGESYLDIANRFFDFIKKVDKKNKNKNILIISHDAPLKAIENIFLGEYNVSKTESFKNAQIKKIDFKLLPYNQNFEIDYHRPYIDEVKFICPECGDTMKRIKEVLDCWVESASMPFAEINYPFNNKDKFENRFPANYITEYISQTRAWFYVMHTLNALLFDDISFKNCVCTGVVLAENGEKMSKLKNNYPDPNLILEKYGADSLRLYLMSSPLLKAENLSFSERGLKDNYKIISILSNILSFYNNYLPEIKAIISDEIGKNKIKESSYSLINNWLLFKLNKLLIENQKALENYNIILASNNIKEFANDFSWYLRVSREKLKKGDKSSVIIFKSVLMELSKIIAPIIPFLAEEIYLEIGGEKESVHLEKWSEIKSLIDTPIEGKIGQLREIITAALNKRAENRIKVRQPLLSLTLKNNELKEPEFLEIIKKEVNVKTIIFDKNINDDIILDTTITEELKNEGTLREIIRSLQQLRKEAELMPKDNIDAYFYTNGPLKQLINNQVRFFKENNVKNLFIKEKIEIKDEEQAKIREIKIGGDSIFIKIIKLQKS